MLDNLRLLERHIRLSNYCGDDLLPESWVRDAERSGLVHARQRPNREVDLDRRDLFPAAVDDLFDAPRKMDISVLVDVSQVAGAEPIAHERLSRELWIVEIAAKDERATDHDLAFRASPGDRAGAVHDRNLVPQGEPRRAAFARTRRKRVMGDRSGFGRRKRAEQGCAKALFEAFDLVGIESSQPGAQKPEAALCDCGSVIGHAAQDRPQQGEPGVQTRRPVLL